MTQGQTVSGLEILIWTHNQDQHDDDDDDKDDYKWVTQSTKNKRKNQKRVSQKTQKITWDEILLQEPCQNVDYKRKIKKTEKKNKKMKVEVIPVEAGVLGTVPRSL